MCVVSVAVVGRFAVVQSFDETAIRNSNPQSAIRNPQSATAWRPLFDGKSLVGWRGYKNAPVPAGWKVAGGALVKDAPVADIVSRDEFGDFELELGWKIGEAGNRGILYRRTAEHDDTHRGA